MRRMHRLVVLLLFLSLQKVSADDFFQRNFVLGELRKTALLGKKFEWPFFTQFEIKKERGLFSSNSGLVAFGAPVKATSAYDYSVSYDLSDFYTSSKDRLHLVANQYIPNTTLLISAGYDSGSTSPKIAISKSWFVGLSGYKKFDKQLYFYFTSGYWQRQRVTESPCVDDYNREYWCPTLIAWSDRPAANFTPGRFLDLRFEYIF